MKKILSSFIIVFFYFVHINCVGQTAPFFTTSNAHAHNDYLNDFPFEAAYLQGFGSIEADIFLKDNNLLVGHTLEALQSSKTLEVMYLHPLNEKLRINNGFPYKDTIKELQLLIDIKSEAKPTIALLIERLKNYPAIISQQKIKLVISGNRPLINEFHNYPSFILFDGEFNKNYDSETWQKIPLISADFTDYAKWNGKGGLTKEEKEKVETAINLAHKLHKKIRFWSTPDFINAWYVLSRLNVDYINTDHIKDLATFFKSLPSTSYLNTNFHKLYEPTYASDNKFIKPKNIILLIGDGMSLPQLNAAYTANRANLQIFTMRQTGLSKTSSADNYVTDSAPGATAFSSGTKTNNRYVGVDSSEKKLLLLPEIFSQMRKKNVVITSGDITDATPASFYAHQKERTLSENIFHDFINAPIDLLLGSGNEKMSTIAILNGVHEQTLKTTAIKSLSSTMLFFNTLDSLRSNTAKRQLVIDTLASMSIIEGRGKWLKKAFEKSVNVVTKNKEGFFMMLESAQIDHAAHDNDLPYLVTETLDFDGVVSAALQFADTNGETLVIVTGDHETGGLTLLGGDYTTGYVFGQFSTNDHTSLPVPVFAYGPQSSLFNGVYENTEIFYKILKAIGWKK